MPVFKIRLFGKLSVYYNRNQVAGLDSSRVQELLCYLLLHRDRPHPRETLASLLWEASSSSQAKKYLRQALWQLQSTLDRQVGEGKHNLLLIEPDWICLNPNADLWLDVDIFEGAFAMVQGVPGQDMDQEQAEAVNIAIQLYQGDLLEGWYQDWCLYERERLQNMWLAMLDKLMAYCEADRRYEEGLVYGMCVLRFDRAHERTHRRMMRMRYMAGDRTAALRQYKRCTQTLEEELGVKPARRTEEIYQGILADDLDQTAEPERSLSTGELQLLPKVVSRLAQLKTILREVHNHVSQDLDRIERALDSQ
jgi:DNA-binding SARP family transcriptional activator